MRSWISRRYRRYSGRKEKGLRRSRARLMLNSWSLRVQLHFCRQHTEDHTIGEEELQEISHVHGSSLMSDVIIDHSVFFSYLPSGVEHSDELLYS